MRNEALDEIFDELCDFMKKQSGLDYRYTRSRRRIFVNLKCCIINNMRRQFGTTLTEIGRLMDLHHSTIIHHIRDHQYRYKGDVDYAELYDDVNNYILEKDFNTNNLDQILVLIKQNFV